LILKCDDTNKDTNNLDSQLFTRSIRNINPLQLVRVNANDTCDAVVWMISLFSLFFLRKQS